MIASLTGTVTAVRLDSAVLVVGGVGLLVYATPATLAGLREGEQGVLFTSLVVREDSLTLYGFSDDDAREVFETLQTVSGVGPRVALAMLAVHTPDGLRQAVAGENLSALMKVPGVGKKGAQRIVLELGDKLGLPRGQGAAAESTPAPAAGRSEQVVDALVGLGWSAKQASEATETVLESLGDQPVATVLKEALRELGRR